MPNPRPLKNPSEISILTVSRADAISLFTRQFGTQPQLVPNQALYHAERERENKFIARLGAPVPSRILIQSARTEPQGVTAWAAVQSLDGWQAVVPSMFLDLR